MHSIIRIPESSECDDSDVQLNEFRTRTVSFSQESKQEDGDFILFPDHVLYPRNHTRLKLWLINRKSYTFLFGAAGCIYSASFRYFNGTITTMEKRFKISSRNTAIISSGNDISQIFASILLTYFASGRNKPKWISLSLYAMAIYCLMSAMPHFLYGPGKDALLMTEEYEVSHNITEMDSMMNSLCSKNEIFTKKCDTEGGALTPQIILFSAQILFGIAESVYYVFGLSYLDDNVSKSQSPLMISLSYLIKMMGPAVGYSIASFCLQFYIDPFLEPTINSKDPRWLGCWWAGWIFIAAILIIFGYLFRFFPKKLKVNQQKTKLDAIIQEQNQSSANKNEENQVSSFEKDDRTNNTPTFEDLIVSLRRLFCNKVLMYNNFSTVFCLFGTTPYWMFSTKYFELQYLQSPSEASFKIGTLGFFFSGLGVLLSGILITKFKPSARCLAAWNIITSAFAVFSMILNNYMGCEANDKSLFNNIKDISNCNITKMCDCDYVKYSPVCGSNNQTYISACHAGCTDEQLNIQLKNKIFTNCSCIEDAQSYAVPGACPMDCYKPMMIFLMIMYLKYFLAASGLAGNFLISLRCVEQRDKPLSVGLMLMMTSLLAFIPAPIYFGMNMDEACILWGKTCTTSGNCWLYDGPKMRFAMNIVGSIFVIIGTCLDGGVWYYAKTLKIFDEYNTNKIEEYNNKDTNAE